MRSLFLARVEIVDAYPVHYIGEVRACRREFILRPDQKPRERIIIALGWVVRKDGATADLGGPCEIAVDPKRSPVRDASKEADDKSYFWLDGEAYAVVGRKPVPDKLCVDSETLRIDKWYAVDLPG